MESSNYGIGIAFESVKTRLSSVCQNRRSKHIDGRHNIFMRINQSPISVGKLPDAVDTFGKIQVLGLAREHR